MPSQAAATATLQAVSASWGKRNVNAACGVTDWRLHDVRRTARTLLSRAGISADTAERCLGHTIRGERGYDRHRYEAEMAHVMATHDLEELDLEWRIKHAKGGDGEPLARWLLDDRPMPPALREFLAGVITGKIKLKRSRKPINDYWREKRVVFMVNYEMYLKGKRRDADLRTHLIEKWCKRCGTTLNAVASCRSPGRLL